MLFGELAPLLPSTLFLLLRDLCVYYWQDAVTRKATQPEAKAAKHGLVWNVREQPCSFVHSLVPCQPSSPPSRLVGAGTRGVFVPHVLATPCPAPAPHLTLLSILLSLLWLPLFSASPCPGIAQQVSSGNSAGDVGRVKRSLLPFLYLSLCLVSIKTHLCSRK